MTMLSCAVLDDYQGAALASADWSRLADRVEVRTVERPLAGVADLAATVGDCEILVIMRERTPFPAEAFEALPRLRLLVHLKLSDRTRGLIGAAELKRMRPTAYLINTSRAQIVNQEALAGALESGWIAGAGADVFEVEPLPAGELPAAAEPAGDAASGLRDAAEP